MSKNTPPAGNSSATDVALFLSRSREVKARQSDPGQRLLFALDATASRQATWDRACHLQAQMFAATRSIADLSMQLCFYRGIDEFRALDWSSDGRDITPAMLNVQCQGGYTQIARVLRHALREHRQHTLRAVIFVGDAMEERAATLYEWSGQLGLGKLPLFMFQEGRDASTAKAFAELSRLSSGVHCQFDEHSEDQLRDLLTAAASFAAGGVEALQRLEIQSPLARKLIASLPRR